MYNKIIPWIKFRMQRGYDYVGIYGMGLVIASVIQEHFLPDVNIIILLLVGVSLLVTIGYIDIKTKICWNDIHQRNIQNPMLLQIRDDVADIRRRCQNDDYPSK